MVDRKIWFVPTLAADNRATWGNILQNMRSSVSIMFEDDKIAEHYRQSKDECYQFFDHLSETLEEQNGLTVAKLDPDMFSRLMTLLFDYNRFICENYSKNYVARTNALLDQTLMLALQRESYVQHLLITFLLEHRDEPMSDEDEQTLDDYLNSLDYIRDAVKEIYDVAELMDRTKPRNEMSEDVAVQMTKRLVEIREKYKSFFELHN